jgi:putative aminopeptidase FrvX
LDIVNLLRKYMLTPSPSGYEGEMAHALADDFRPFCDEVWLDRNGNCIGKVQGSGSGIPRAMVFAHIDQLGFIVRKVEADGFLRLDRLGGIPEKVLPGLQLLIRSEDGQWHPGVIGSKSHHTASAEEKYRVEKVTELFVDLGAKSAEAVHDKGIYTGCPAIYRPSFLNLADGRVSGTAVDNRGGCTCLVDIAEQLSRDRPPGDVYLVGTVWEEFNLRGAMLAARTVKPDIAISLDVTLAGDTRDLSDHFDNVLGKGPSVELYSFHGRGTLNGTLPHEGLFRLAKEKAAAIGCPLQRFAALGILTDTSYIQLEGGGVACLEMGFPARYTHTPVEVCDVNDLASLSRLVAAMMRGVDKNFKLDRL